MKLPWILAIASTCLLAGCVHDPAPRPMIWRDVGGGAHYCSNPICWKVESDLCSTVSALTYIEMFPTNDVGGVARRALDRHWKAMGELSK